MRISTGTHPDALYLLKDAGSVRQVGSVSTETVKNNRPYLRDHNKKQNIGLQLEPLALSDRPFNNRCSLADAHFPYTNT